ncbi:hypothetical protein KAU33_06620 [Candidatus Dependentiae bacterium]|nr:hypothetical protein [Candidatus Dependentiae bacterium]
MQYKVEICKGCGFKRNIINRKYGLCQECNRARLHPEEGKITAGIKRTVQRNSNFNYDTSKGFDSELKMFRVIWNTQPHISFISGKPLHNFDMKCFIHVLAKGLNKYPHFRYYQKNVVLGTWEEHLLFDQGTKEQRDDYDGDFEPLYKLAEELKKEYKIFYG